MTTVLLTFEYALREHARDQGIRSSSDGPSLGADSDTWSIFALHMKYVSFSFINFTINFGADNEQHG